MSAPVNSENRGIDKGAYLRQVVQYYTEMLERAREACALAQGDANDHKGRIESRYDTFREEAQFLAGGQERRCLELQETIRALQRFMTDCFSLAPGSQQIRPGALVRVLDENGREEDYLLSPHGGGMTVETEQGKLWIISVQSPLGSGLKGKCAGQIICLTAGANIRRLKILAVC